jgi:predicted dehydrogenase
MKKQTPLHTVIVGFGKIGEGYAHDPLMARYYPYATHAQVLSVHPAYAWDAVVDMSEPALDIARRKWNIPLAVRCVDDLPADFRPDLAIIATPPESRLAILEQLPSVRGILVEKPLGKTLEESQRFLDYCKVRNIQVQVNYWRRADETFKDLSEKRLRELIGGQQAVFGIYCNGLLNNGSHMVDFVRMLCGEIAAASVISKAPSFEGSPVPGDINISCALRLAAGPVAMLQPVRVEHYRENGLDIWGEQGRLSILLSGMGIIWYPRLDNRAMQNEREVALDRPTMLTSTVGQALYRMYDNLADAMINGSNLWSPGESALKTARVVQALFESSARNGETIAIEEQ